MSLEKIAGQLKGLKTKVPPVEQWNPPYCGEMDLIIKGDGTWFYNGTPFKRPALVKLLASVLKREGDDYFLVTPVEKIKITVEDAPFVITQWQWQDDAKQVMVLATQLDDELMLGEQHPLEVRADGEFYVCVRRNLWGRVHRNVYYQWIEEAQTSADGLRLELASDGQVFALGEF